MLRLSKVILKDKLFEFVNNPEISKVEIIQAKNKFNNQDICRVYIYLKCNFNDIATIIGCCKKEQAVERQWKHGNKAYTTGVCSSIQQGFMSTRMIKELTRIEQEENINFSIPKYFHDLIIKWKDKDKIEDYE